MLGHSQETTSDSGLGQVALLEAVRRGDTAAMVTAYDMHAECVHAFATRMVGSQAADDVTAGTFTDFWDHPPQPDEARGGIELSLLDFAHLRAAQLLRRTDVQMATEPVVELTARLQDLLGRATDRARAALESLPAPQSRVFTLVYYGAYTINQSSRLLGRTPARVNRSLAQAMEALRAQS